MKAFLLMLLASTMPASPAVSNDGFGCDIKWEGNVLTKTGKCVLRGGGAASPSKRVRSAKPAAETPDDGGETPGGEEPGGETPSEDDGNNGHGNDDDHDDDSNPGQGGGNHGTGNNGNGKGRNK